MRNENEMLLKANRILHQLPLGLDMARDWSAENWDEYYLYFHHPTKQIRVSALLVFLAALDNFRMQSAFPFTQKEGELRNEDHIYFDLDLYLTHFLQSSKEIKKDLPAMYDFILLRFREASAEHDIHNYLESAHHHLFERMLELIYEVDQGKTYDFAEVVEEAGESLEFEENSYE